MDRQLVENPKEVLLKSWTVRIGAFFGALSGVMQQSDGIVVAIVSFLPYWLRLPAAAFVGLVIFGGPVIAARLTHKDIPASETAS